MRIIRSGHGVGPHIRKGIKIDKKRSREIMRVYRKLTKRIE